MAVQRHDRRTAAVLVCRVYEVTSNTKECLDCGPKYGVKFGGRNTASTALQHYCYGDLSVVGHDAVWVGEYL